MFPLPGDRRSADVAPCDDITWPSRACDAKQSRRVRELGLVVLAALLGGCAADAPVPYGEVVTFKAGQTSTLSGYPPPGTVWRLDDADLKALSPAPIVPAPPPPRLPPPPRPNDPPPYYYPPPPPPWYYAPPF
jgi:hypothetical protein